MAYPESLLYSPHLRVLSRLLLLVQMRRQGLPPVLNRKGLRCLRPRVLLLLVAALQAVSPG